MAGEETQRTYGKRRKSLHDNLVQQADILLRDIDDMVEARKSDDDIEDRFDEWIDDTTTILRPIVHPLPPGS